MNKLIKQSIEKAEKKLHSHWLSSSSFTVPKGLRNSIELRSLQSHYATINEVFGALCAVYEWFHSKDCPVSGIASDIFKQIDDVSGIKDFSRRLVDARLVLVAFHTPRIRFGPLYDSIDKNAIISISMP